MINLHTRRTRPGVFKANADVLDEKVQSGISNLDPEQQNGPSNSLLWVITVAALLWVATVAALLIWGSLWLLLDWL